MRPTAVGRLPLEGTGGGAIAALTQLLQEAERALGCDWAKARSCVAKAAVLLQGADAAPACRSDDPECGLAPWQVRRAVAYIEEHLDGPIRMEALAECTRLSPGYFSRAFKRSIGHPPQVYIARTRPGARPAHDDV